MRGDADGIAYHRARVHDYLDAHLDQKILAIELVLKT